MNTYKQNVKDTNIQTLRHLLDRMPGFCKDFIRGISNSTEIRTQVAYCRDIYHFLNYIKAHNPEFKDIDIRDIPFELLERLSPADIDEYLEFLSLYEIDGVVYSNENASKARKLSSLSKLYDFYIKRQQLKNNPISAIERPKINDKAIIALSPEQIIDLIKYVSNPVNLTERQQKFHERTYVRDAAILTLFLGTGIRVSELVGLDVDDIDFTLNSIRVVRKGGREAFVYFGDAVASALSAYIGPEREKLLKGKTNDSPALFLSLRGTRLTVRSVENLVKKYSSMLETNKKITPHKLRSTFGTEIYSKTGDIYLTAELLGQRDINTTKKHYASMDQDKLHSVVNLIELEADE